MKKQPRYIPAFHFHWLTHYYDPMIRLMFPEETLKTAITNQAHLQASQKLLDIGCGTGTLALLLKQSQPNTVVYGIDIDTRILAIAERKAGQMKTNINLQQASATCLPYPDESFDHVFASLLLHHLTQQDKLLALKEAYRILKPGGELHVADFCKPRNSIMWLISLLVRWLEEIHDNVLGLLPVFMSNAGFRPVKETAIYRTIFGQVALYHAIKPIQENQ